MTQVVLDAGFGAERWYSFLEKRRVTVWYSAPTAIRLLMKEGLEPVKRHDLSSLRHLASVGEPLNPEAVHWSREAYGLPFHDTFWQTETGCIVVSNYPGMPIKAGSMGKPFPGITAAILDLKTFEPVAEPGRVGMIGLVPGWPSMIRGYWNNPAGYAKKFANGWYLTGDRGTVDADGYFWFVGRDDDVINTGRAPRRAVRGGVGPPRAPGRRRVGRGGQARPGEHGGRQGVRHAQAGTTRRLPTSSSRS